MVLHEHASFRTRAHGERGTARPATARTYLASPWKHVAFEQSNSICSHPLSRGTTICLYRHGGNAAKRTCANVADGPISSARDMSSTVSRYSRATGRDVSAEDVQRWS